jgi:NAD(P)H-dependent flavin oxidoreductase YrpB (nitropropane dioxygenase family)
LVEKMTQGENSLNPSAGAGLEEAWVKGDLTAGTLPAGQVSGLISRIFSVREVIEEMVG